MAGEKPINVWQEHKEGGYLSSPQLSHLLREALQPSCRFRQLCTPEDAVGLHRGQIFHWPIFGDLDDDGQELAERSTMPITGAAMKQGTLEIKEHGMSVPYTETLDDASYYPVSTIIRKSLANSAKKHLDRAAHAQFNKTPLVVSPKDGTSSTEAVLSENGTALTANNTALSKKHVKQISILMRERNIPPFQTDCYHAIGRPMSFATLTDELEAVHQYTQRGIDFILAGERGRYEGVRFVEQTNIASEGWANGKSDGVFFIGQDAVAEGCAIPEELRAKIGQDYGRDRGIAWYYLGGFGLALVDAEDARVVKWGTA